MWKINEGRGRKQFFVIFFIWECFNRRWVRVSGNLPSSQKVWKKSSRRILRTWNSVTSTKARHQAQHPVLLPRSPPKKITPLTSTILTTPPKFHSSTPLSSKQKKPPKEQLSHWNTKAHPKSQSPQTNQKIIFTTSHITFTPPTLQQLPQQTHMPSFTFPTIFQSVEQCGATGHHPEKA